MLIGSLTDNANLNGCSISNIQGKYAYVGCYMGKSLTVLNVSNPTSPTYVVSLVDATNIGSVGDVEVVGKYAYLTSDNNNRFTVVDISKPYWPTLVASVQDTTNLNGASTIEIAGHFAYVTASNRVTVVDIANPTNPQVVSSLLDATHLNGADQGDIRYHQGYLYVGARYVTAVTVIDVSNPYNPTYAGWLQDSTNLDFAVGMGISGRYLYVASRNNHRLTILDIINPTTPTYVGSVQDNTNLIYVTGLKVAGNYVYTQAPRGGGRVSVIDVSNPYNPTLLTTVQFGGGITNAGGWRGDTLQIAGQYLYIAAADSNSFHIMKLQNVASLAISSLAIASLKVEIPSENNSSTEEKLTTSYRSINFTVNNTMSRRNPVANSDNQIQIRLANGMIVPLTYQTTEDEQTVWTGKYNLPKGTTNLTSLKGAVEAIAYDITTDVVTHFITTLPPGFNNTGVVLNFDIPDASPGAYTIDNSSPSAVLKFIPSQIEKKEENILSRASELIRGLISNLFTQISNIKLDLNFPFNILSYIWR